LCRSRNSTSTRETVGFFLKTEYKPPKYPYLPLYLKRGRKPRKTQGNRQGRAFCKTIPEEQEKNNSGKEKRAKIRRDAFSRQEEARRSHSGIKTHTPREEENKKRTRREE